MWRSTFNLSEQIFINLFFPIDVLLRKQNIFLVLFVSVLSNVIGRS